MATLSGAVPATVIMYVKSPTVNQSIVYINNGARDTATVKKVYVGGDPYNNVDLLVSGETHNRINVVHESIVKISILGIVDGAWNLT